MKNLKLFLSIVIMFVSASVFAATSQNSPFNVKTVNPKNSPKKTTQKTTQKPILKRVAISGQQTRGVPGRNAKLTSKMIKLTKDSKVVSVSGNNNGFWITGTKGAVAKYYQPNDKKVIGLVLKKGSYSIYPNLKKMENTATVTTIVQ
jgi:hypothetical protein